LKPAPHASIIVAVTPETGPETSRFSWRFSDASRVLLTEESTMARHRVHHHAIALILVFIGPGIVCPTAMATELRYDDRWRLEADGSARSDGEIVFRVTPEGGESAEITVQIVKGTSENGVARKIRDAFRQQLVGDYKIKTDDGEEVTIRARGETPAFALELVSSSVEHTSIEIRD
jgi:hypothetical protein